jgi:hypothetical protein
MSNKVYSSVGALVLSLSRDSTSVAPFPQCLRCMPRAIRVENLKKSASLLDQSEILEKTFEGLHYLFLWYFWLVCCNH